jgi:carboxylesterase
MAGKGFFYPGGRQGVLLIHGLTGTPTEMKHIGKGLARLGFTVYGVQLAGHCGTEADLLATGWQDWYRSIESAMLVLRSCVDHVFAAGLSMGAILALHLAAEHPDRISGLALYSTSFWYDGWSTPPLAGFLPLLMRLPFGRRYRFMEAFPYGVKDERIRQWVLNHMQQGDSSQAGLLGTPGPSLLEHQTLAEIVKRELPSIRTPTLVVHASEDDLTSVRNADFVEHTHGGLVKKVMLDDCYHLITIDRQRDVVVAESAAFFCSVVRSKTSSVDEKRARVDAPQRIAE